MLLVGPVFLGGLHPTGRTWGMSNRKKQKPRHFMHAGFGWKPHRGANSTLECRGTKNTEPMALERNWKDCAGDYTTQSNGDYFISHYKGHYQPTSISWNVIRVWRMLEKTSPKTLGNLKFGYFLRLWGPRHSCVEQVHSPLHWRVQMLILIARHGWTGFRDSIERYDDC